MRLEIGYARKDTGLSGMKTAEDKDAWKSMVHNISS